jgi:hypothetical protein
MLFTPINRLRLEHKEVLHFNTPAYSYFAVVPVPAGL